MPLLIHGLSQTMLAKWATGGPNDIEETGKWWSKYRKRTLITKMEQNKHINAEP